MKYLSKDFNASTVMVIYSIQKRFGNMAVRAIKTLISNEKIEGEMDTCTRRIPSKLIKTIVTENPYIFFLLSISQMPFT